MSSTGQIVGMFAGAVVGFFNPALGVALGASIGGAIGSAIDPPKGPDIVGPRLDDLSVQTATYGAALPRSYGTVCVSGNIFWLENDQIKELTTTEEQGGKGGGGSETTTYSYSATFACGLMHVPAGDTVSLRRLWIDTDLIYEADSSNIDSIIASYSTFGDRFTFYKGSDDQLPNSRMQADKGASNVSAYPGVCYIVFEDLNLEKYSNTLLRAQIKAELVIGPGVFQEDNLYDLPTPDLGQWDYRDEVAQIRIGPTGVDYAAAMAYGNNGYYNYMKFGRVEFSYSYTETLDTYADSWWGYANGFYTATQSDIDAVLTMQCSSMLGLDIKFRLFTPGAVAWSTNYITQDNLLYSGRGYVVFDRGDIILNTNGWVPAAHPLGRIHLLDINTGWIKESDAFPYLGPHYASENYIFLISDVNNGTTTTIRKIARSDYSLVATLTYAQIPPRLLQIVSDDEFYSAHTMSGGTRILKWVNGTVVKAWAPGLLQIMQTNADACAFYVGSEEPYYAISAVSNGSGASEHLNFTLAHEVVPAAGSLLRDVVTAECALAGITSGDLDLTSLTNSTVRGFRVAERGAVRNALEPLQAAYPFDVAQAGYKIRFITRGGASVAAIPSDDLGATDGEVGVLLPVSREMDSQLPFRVSIRYTDPDREYDIGEQSISRDEKDSLNERVMELPLSLTSAEAIQMADVLLAKEWTERQDFGPFALPPTWHHLEAADVVTVSHRGQDHTLRLTRIEYLADGRVVCSAKLTAAQSYISSAIAQPPLVSGESLVPLHGTTEGYLLDIPRIRSEQDVIGMSYGMTGLASGWPGATLLRSDDSGNSYQSIGAVNARAKVFTSTPALSAHHGYSIDHAAILTVTPRYSGHTLSSVNELQLYAHSNLAAYGIDGRWEIIAFQTVVDNTGSYTLKDFLRGLYGTEQYTGTHVAGDYFILLDTATVSFFGLPSNAIGSQRIYKAVTQGASIDSILALTHTYGATNIKPLSPVDLNGFRDPALFDWSLSWSRRSRTPTELFSSVAVPIGESAESYDLEIWNSTYTTLKRTFTAIASPEVIYTNAQQVADFGSLESTLYVKVFQNSYTIGRGYPLTTSIYRFMSADPFGDTVSLLMHWTTDMTDFKGHTVTASGAAISGGYCVFDGVDDYVILDGASNLFPGTGDFTYELMVTPVSLSRPIWLRDDRPGGTNGGYITLYLNTTGEVALYVNSGVQITSSTGVCSINNEYHIAVCRSGTSTRLFIDGTQHGSAWTDTTNYLSATSRPMIMGSGFDPSNAVHRGAAKVREVRYTPAARYIANFTPPTSPLPNP